MTENITYVKKKLKYPNPLQIKQNVYQLFAVRASTIALIAAACFAAVACFCTHDDNPFTDPSNARAVVSHASFADRDTVSIFTTETLQIRVAVRELVDSVSVVTPGNRRGLDTGVIGNPDPAGPSTILFSFSDTGWTTVTISTFRKNGETVSSEYSLYCRSPLFQPDIKARYGDSIALSTTPVGDEDVSYHWDFGSGYVVSSHVPHASAFVKYVAPHAVGALWVSDPEGANPSPTTGFGLDLTDSAGPRIVCVNLRSSAPDTILTGDTTFYLRLKIWDPAQTMPVFQARVNGQVFSIDDDPYYIHIFGSMDTARRVFPVVVSAIDNQLFRNTSKDTFYLRFSDTMAHSNGIVFTISDPSTDSSISQTRDKVVFGKIEDYAHDSIAVVVRMWLNGTPVLPPDTARGKFIALWNFQCSLSDGKNTIKLAAYSVRGDTLASKMIQILYDPALKDSVPPVILEITADGREADNFHTPSDSAIVRIIAFDEASGMQSVTINNAVISPAPGGHGFIWYDTVALAHNISGTAFSVIAIDKAANTAKASFLMFKNSVPEITRAPSFPDKIFAGTTYSDFLLWQDTDGDPVVVTKISGPSSVSVFQNGRIDWKPLIVDEGPQSVIISLFDGYESVEFSFRATVIGDTTNMPPSVRFATTLADFPQSLEVNRDSLVMVLKTINTTGNTPLDFSAALQSGSSPITLRDSVLFWRPAISDTGRQTLRCIVNDRYRRSDTLSPVIVVVPQNRPCSLLVSSTIPKFADGQLDLSHATEPETLFFSVHDPDPAVSEQLLARIRWPASESVIGIDSSRQFILILKPKTAVTKSKDTVRVIIQDRAGHKDSLTFFLSYVPERPVFTDSITLVINTSSGGVSISQNVTNFPLLVRLDKSFFPFQQAGRNGQGIRFTKSNGTVRPYEIESWDSAGGNAAVWVLLDTVFVNNSTQNVRMAWGAATGPGTSDGKAVFDTARGFLGVWHMSDASLRRNMNSAQDTFNATLSPTGNNPALLTGDGIISHADSLPDNSFLLAGNLPTPQQVTISTWVNPVHVTTCGKIVCKPWTSYAVPYQIYSLEVAGTNTTAVQFHVGFSVAYSAYATSDNVLPLNTWTNLTGTYDGTTIRLYVNGIMTTSTQMSPVPAPPVPANNQPWTIGSWNLTNGEYAAGKFDEVRICRGAFGPDFIRLSYENQRAGSTMVTFSTVR